MVNKGYALENKVLCEGSLHHAISVIFRIALMHSTVQYIRIAITYKTLQIMHVASAIGYHV